LSEILTWVEKLNEVDTEDVDPLTNMSQEINILRDDKPGNPLEHEKGLKNVPEKLDGFIKVPRIKD